jgi:hypothetical protein
MCVRGSSDEAEGIYRQMAAQPGHSRVLAETILLLAGQSERESARGYFQKCVGAGTHWLPVSSGATRSWRAWIIDPRWPTWIEVRPSR